MPTTMHRCSNTADGCWREFDEKGFYVTAADKKFCGDLCRSAWLQQSNVFNEAANPFHLPRHPPRPT